MSKVRTDSQPDSLAQWPMRDLKEAVTKMATQARCEPLVGLEGRARNPRLSNPNILSVIRPGKGLGMVYERSKNPLLFRKERGFAFGGPGKSSCDPILLSLRSLVDMPRLLMYSEFRKSVTSDIQKEQSDGYDNTGSSAGYVHLAG